jgi:hypothetical protein
MTNGPIRHPPKTLKQAKQEYKLRSGPQLSAQQLRHIDRRLELDERAKKCKDKEKRRKELAKKKKEKEEGDRERNKASNISLSTQLAGFSHTQIGLKRKMEAWVVSGNAGVSKRQKTNDKENVPEPEDEFDSSDKENEPVPRASLSNQHPRQLSVPRPLSPTSPNMPPVEPAEHLRSQNNQTPSCNSQRSTSGLSCSFHTAPGGIQDNSNMVNQEEEFDFIDDDELMEALEKTMNTTPSSKTLSLAKVGHSPKVLGVLQGRPSESEKVRTDHCPQSRSPHSTLQPAPAPAFKPFDLLDIPDDYWVTDSQLERDMAETPQETMKKQSHQQRIASSEEFDSSFPWDLLDENKIIADLLGESPETSKAENDAQTEQATLAGANSDDIYTIGLSTQLIMEAAAEEDFYLDEESPIPVQR